MAVFSYFQTPQGNIPTPGTPGAPAPMSLAAVNAFQEKTQALVAAHPISQTNLHFPALPQNLWNLLPKNLQAQTQIIPSNNIRQIGS